MELEQLRIFCTVAACRSFTRAAGQLFVSHSTTSRAVSALERELGVPLLVRDRHTVALTPAGQTLLTGAEDLLRQADALAAAVQTAGGVILADCTNFFAKFLRLSEKPS